jgi:putative transposase
LPRANRHFIPGHVWHITHRCHKKEFLLKFSKDRRQWIKWLFEARKRYNTSILDYIVTSNHIHLLVYDTGEPESIPKMMQLVAGRTAQEYNQRKSRKGAFWEDRYHATAIEKDEHLVHCLVYIDLNMVRAGVVDHPSDWKESGYNEIQNPRQRYAIIDHDRLLQLFEKRTIEDLKASHKQWVDLGLAARVRKRERKWAGSIAVGSDDFVSDTKRRLGIGRVVADADDFVLHEAREPYTVKGEGEDNTDEWMGSV